MAVSPLWDPEVRPRTYRSYPARWVSQTAVSKGEGRVQQLAQLDAGSLASARRGGQKSGTNRPKGQTKEQLYHQAKRLKVEGRSTMNKAQLQRAVSAKSR